MRRCRQKFDDRCCRRKFAPRHAPIVTALTPFNGSGTMAHAQELHDGRPGAVGRGAGDASPAPERQSWRERLGALRNLPPFLKLVWRTSPTLTLGQALLRIVRALLPVATLYVGKLIIDEVVLLVQVAARGRRSRASGSRAGCSIASAGCWRWSSGWRSLSDVLGRAVSLLDSLLSERFSNETSLRLMEHAATLDLEDFEDSELQDRLERARRQAAGRTSLIGQLFARRRTSSPSRASPRGSSSSRRGSSCCSPSRSCPRSSARRTSTRRAIRSTTRARRSGASSTTSARRARARKRRRK